MKQTDFSPPIRFAAASALSAALFALCACADSAAGIASSAPVLVEFRLPQWQEEFPVQAAPRGEEAASARIPTGQDAGAVLRAPLVRWDIEAAQGKDRRTFRVEPAKTSVVLELNRNEACALLARPVVRAVYAEPAAEIDEDSSNMPELTFFHPCGAVYPFQTELSWKDGFAASCLSDFYAYALSSGVAEAAAVRHASCFNWAKFSSSLELKGGAAEAFYNPWQLDKNAVLNAIAARSFSVTLLAQKKSCAVASEQLSDPARFILVSQYIPQNEIAGKSGEFTLKEAVPETFLRVPRGGDCESMDGEDECGVSEAKLLTATMHSSANARQITLALKSIPIYTETQ